MRIKDVLDQQGVTEMNGFVGIEMLLEEGHTSSYMSRDLSNHPCIQTTDSE